MGAGKQGDEGRESETTRKTDGEHPVLSPHRAVERKAQDLDATQREEFSRARGCVCILRRRPSSHNGRWGTRKTLTRSRTATAVIGDHHCTIPTPLVAALVGLMGPTRSVEHQGVSLCPPDPMTTCTSLLRTTALLIPVLAQQQQHLCRHCRCLRRRLCHNVLSASIWSLSALPDAQCRAALLEGGLVGSGRDACAAWPGDELQAPVKHRRELQSCSVVHRSPPAHHMLHALRPKSPAHVFGAACVEHHTRHKTSMQLGLLQ
eukprot:3940548-Rhodomonas_salina.4